MASSALGTHHLGWVGTGALSLKPEYQLSRAERGPRQAGGATGAERLGGQQSVAQVSCHQQRIYVGREVSGRAHDRTSTSSSRSTAPRESQELLLQSSPQSLSCS